MWPGGHATGTMATAVWSVLLDMPGDSDEAVVSTQGVGYFQKPFFKTRGQSLGEPVRFGSVSLWRFDEAGNLTTTKVTLAGNRISFDVADRVLPVELFSAKPPR